MKKVTIRKNSTNSYEVYQIGDTLYCRSYNSLVGKFEDGILTLGRMWRCSRTTSKHLHNFVSGIPIYNTLENIKGRSIADRIQRGIDMGVFILDKDMSL